MYYHQSEFDIRCEWGEKAVYELTPISDAVIVVDVLSFSTSVEIATSQGAIVFPYRWKDESVYTYAESVEAEVANHANKRGLKLAPSSLLNLPKGIRLVLPSPNGSTLSLSTGDTATFAGCIRNCEAIAAAAMTRGRIVSVIMAGERWEDNSLRPCFEDLVGAGSIIQYLRGKLSPESLAAVAAFEKAAKDLHRLLRECSSGKEKVGKGADDDMRLAAEINVSKCVPLLIERAYVNKVDESNRFCGSSQKPLK